MRYAILGDIHANRAALDAVLADAAEQAIDRYACVGDIVGYNADPSYCLQKIRPLVGRDVVRGNHDHYCMGQTLLTGVNPAAAVIHKTRAMLSDEERAYLASLPLTRTITPPAAIASGPPPSASGARPAAVRVVGRRPDTFMLVHGTLDMPDQWGYVFDTLQAEASLAYQLCPVCFCGHTHVPIAFEKAATIRSGLYDTLHLVDGHKYLVNVGSVGQPRDGDPRAAYAVYDETARTVTLRRVEYDIASTQERIRAAGFPERLALRLEAGK